MTRWFEVALSGPVVRRALKCALIVGPILIAINHGHVLLQGVDIEGSRLARMLLTFFVPYAVSTVSSVAAILEAERGGS